MRAFAAFLMVLAFALTAAPIPLRAQQSTALIVVVTDSTQRPIAGASVRITGAGQTPAAVATDARGEGNLAATAGLYRVSISAPGYDTVDANDVTVLDGQVTRLAVVLIEQSTLREIGRVRTAGGAGTLNQTISATGTIAAAQRVETRGNANLTDYVYEVPGLTYFHSAKSSTNHFKIRGADNEPRTELDGHPLTNTGAGNFLIGWLNAYAFDRIDIEKGPGISEGDEGRTAFGTINMVSREFSSRPSIDAVFGLDSASGSVASLLARGALAAGKLQYVFGTTYSGLPDPVHNGYGFFLGPTKTNVSGSSALIAYGSTLSEGIGLRDEIAKVRYQFSPSTSLMAGFIGFHGKVAPLGGAYVGYEGDYTIVPCFTNGVPVTSAASCTPASTFTNPAFASAIGTVQSTYSGYASGSETNNEPFFEGRLETTIGKGRLSISPFTMMVSDLLAYQPPAVPVAGLPNSRFTSDRMHGTTVTYVAPLRNGYVKLNYEYRSDQTLVYNGAAFNFASLTTPVTTLRENDLSLTSLLELSPRLSLGLGLFSSASHYDTQIQDPAAIAGGSAPATTPFVSRSVAFTHLDPHVGLVFRTTPDLTVRASFGSAVYGPGNTLISGKATFAPPAPSNNNLGLLTLVNPGLKPEVTVAYGLGFDQRLHDGGVLSFDLYNDLIHDKFLAFTYQGGPITTPSGIVNPLITQTINASLQRNYGAEIALHRERPVGWGYDLALNLNRQYFDQIPLSYFAYSNGPLSPFNGYQGTTNPYSTLHGELRFGAENGAYFALGGDMVGANNTLRAPGYTLFYGTIKQPVARNAALVLSVENLLNFQTAAGLIGAGPAGSGASTITAYPQNGAAGGPLVYSQQLVSVLPATPRVIRLNLVLHGGRPGE